VLHFFKKLFVVIPFLNMIFFAFFQKFFQKSLPGAHDGDFDPENICRKPPMIMKEKFKAVSYMYIFIDFFLHPVRAGQ
jgi:hypothetical protein